MKKILSSIIIAAFLVAMVFSFTGCSDASKFVGTWRADVDITEQLKSSMGTKTAPYLTDVVTLPIVMTFNSDGTIEMSVEAEEFIATFKTVITNTLTSYLEATLEGTGMSVEDALKASNTTMEDLINDAMEGADVDSLEEKFSMTGTYEAEDGKLYLLGSGEEKEDSEYITYEFDGDNLTLTQIYEADGEVADSPVPFPWVFVKK